MGAPPKLPRRGEVSVSFAFLLDTRRSWTCAPLPDYLGRRGSLKATVPGALPPDAP